MKTGFRPCGAACICFTVYCGEFSLCSWRNTGGNATLNQGRTIGVAVVTFVAQKRARSRQVQWQCCAPLWPDCCPSVSNSSTGRISPSQTACGLEFSPPLVWPIARGTTDKHQTTDLTMTPCGSAQGERLIKWDNDRTIYKRQKEVERLFRRLKGYRRIFSRFENLMSCTVHS